MKFFEHTHLLLPASMFSLLLYIPSIFHAHPSTSGFEYDRSSILGHNKITELHHKRINCTQYSNISNIMYDACFKYGIFRPCFSPVQCLLKLSRPAIRYSVLLSPIDWFPLILLILVQCAALLSTFLFRSFQMQCLNQI